VKVTDKAVEVCPVGVIIRKRVGFATRSASAASIARRSAPRPSRTRRDRWRDTMTDVTRRKLKVATTSLAGCFGCHMSFLDIDERLFPLLERIEFDRSPLTDIKHCGPCDIGIIEGGICNAENVHVLRSSAPIARSWWRWRLRGDGGLPAQRNHLDLGQCLQEVYLTEPSVGQGSSPTTRSCRCRSTRCTRCTRS